jgi:HEAT repeat protein
MLSFAMTPMNLEEYAAYYIDRLADDENAHFALIEAPRAIIPILSSAFRSESDAAKRSMTLHVIWQYRDPSTIPLIGEGLQDSSPLVWKQALDGLIAIGGPESISIIEAAYGRHFGGEVDQAQFQLFLDEALEQLRSAEP